MIGTLVEIVARQFASSQVLYTDADVPAGFEACSVAEAFLDVAALPRPETFPVGVEPDCTRVSSAPSDLI